MTIEEFGQGYALLVTTYGKQLAELSEEERKEQRKLFYATLRHIEASVWQEAVGVIITTSKWFPKLSECFDVISGLSSVSGDGATAEAAWALAQRAVKRLDPLRLVPLSDVRPDVERVIRELGGWARFALIENEELGWYRKEFLAAWEGRYAISARAGLVEGDALGRLGSHAGAGADPRAIGEGEP